MIITKKSAIFESYRTRRTMVESTAELDRLFCERKPPCETNVRPRRNVCISAAINVDAGVIRHGAHLKRGTL